MQSEIYNIMFIKWKLINGQPFCHIMIVMALLTSHQYQFTLALFWNWRNLYVRSFHICWHITHFNHDLWSRFDLLNGILEYWISIWLTLLKFGFYDTIRPMSYGKKMRFFFKRIFLKRVFSHDFFSSKFFQMDISSRFLRHFFKKNYVVIFQPDSENSGDRMDFVNLCRINQKCTI